jgi:hypothetical protein
VLTSSAFRLLRDAGGIRSRRRSRDKGGIVVAGMTGEGRDRRASSRARRAAEAAEADDRRVEGRRLQWQREGVYMTRAKIEAGEPCRGCGQPLLDGLGDRGPLSNLTPDQRAACDRAEELYRERHRDCRSHRWSLGGHRALHCGYCCPMPPLPAEQARRAAQVLSSVRTRPEGLDAWDLMLTCGHTVRRAQHRDHGDRHSWQVTECAQCGQRRGVVSAQRTGPARRPRRTGRP